MSTDHSQAKDTVSRVKYIRYVNLDDHVRIIRVRNIKVIVEYCYFHTIRNTISNPYNLDKVIICRGNGVNDSILFLKIHEQSDSVFFNKGRVEGTSKVGENKSLTNKVMKVSIHLFIMNQ
jgi:hypothetical protein